LRAARFNEVLNRTAGTDAARLVGDVVLRSQSQAEYSPDNIGHFGLNLRRYAHFTSPIRRYADLIVHRALIRALDLGDDGLPPAVAGKVLKDIAERISASERRAMSAERETIDRLIAHFLADRVGEIFQGRVSGVTRAGLFVKLDETGADGFVAAATIGRDYYRFEETHHALIGSATGETFQLGDRLSVKLVEAAPLAGALRFEIVSDSARPRPTGRTTMPRRPRITDRRPKPGRGMKGKRK
jgi:ribonuclease R